MKKSILGVLAIASIALVVTSCGRGNSTNTSATSNTGVSSVTTSSGASSVPLTPAEKVLKSLQGRISASGTGVTQYVGESVKYTSKIEIIVTESAYSNYELAEDGTEYDGVLYKDPDNSHAVSYYIDANNEVAKSEFQYDTDDDDIADTYLEFAEYANPFTSLTAADLTQSVDSEENVYFSISEEKRDPAGVVFSGYNETYASFDIYVDEEGQASRFLFVTNEIHVEESVYVSTYDYTIDALGDDVDPIEIPKPYEETADHAVLKTALAEIKGSSFTLTHTDKMAGEEDIVYNYYFTDDAIYCDVDTPETEPFGWVDIDGTVYEFETVGGELTIGDSISESINDLRPQFNEFHPALLESKGEGNFSAYEGVVIPVFLSFAEDSNAAYMEDYITYCNVSISDGHLSSVSYGYDMFGYIVGDVTTEYSNIGSTVIPVTLPTLA